MEEEKNNHKIAGDSHAEENPAGEDHAGEHHKGSPKKDEKTVTLKEADYLGLLEEAKKGKDGWDKMLRNQADLENTRKRIEKEKQEFIKKVPLEMLVLETDSPFLSPDKKFPNEPKNIKIIVEFIASLLHCSTDRLAKETTENARRLFKISNF